MFIKPRLTPICCHTQRLACVTAVCLLAYYPLELIAQPSEKNQEGAEISAEVIQNKKVAALFSSMQKGAFKGQSFPELNREDIPALLQLGVSQQVLKTFPRNPISSQYEETCLEGIVAVWLVEGIRNGSQFPSLNALCLPKGKTKEKWAILSARHQGDLVSAYRDWWKQTKNLPADEANEMDPLKEMGLHWY